MSDQVKAIEGLTAALNGLVSQTPQQAIEEQVRLVNERAVALEAKEKEIEAKLAKFDAEIKAQATKPERRSEYNLRDANAVIADYAGLKPTTKGLYGRIGREAAANSSLWKERFGASHPIEVLIRGAFTTARVNGQENLAPFTAGADDEVLREVQDLNDGVFWWMACKRANSSLGLSPDPRQCPVWGQYESALKALYKALDETDFANFVPTGWSSQIVERYDMDRVLTKYLRLRQIPRSPFADPALTTRPTAYLIGENTADPESATKVTTSDPTDANITWTLKTIGLRTAWSYRLDDDSIVSTAGMVRDEQAAAVIYAEEDAIINGDDSSPHQDADVSFSTTDRRVAWKGFRKKCLAASCSTDISSFVSTSFSGMIGSMNQFGGNPDKLCWIVPPTVRAKLLTLLHATSGYPVMVGIPGLGITTTGQVPSLFGSPIAVCESFRTTLNAAGIYDGTTTTYTGVILFNRERWGLAYINQAPLVETDRDIQTQQIIAVTSIRRHFQPLDTISTSLPSAWFGYKVTS